MTPDDPNWQLQQKDGCQWYIWYIPTPAMVFFLKPDDKIMGLWGFAVNSQTNPAKLIQPLAPHVLTKRFAAMPWR